MKQPKPTAEATIANLRSELVSQKKLFETKFKNLEQENAELRKKVFHSKNLILEAAAAAGVDPVRDPVLNEHGERPAAGKTGVARAIAANIALQQKQYE